MSRSGPSNEIRIGAQTRVGGALRYAHKVLVTDKEDHVVIRGSGTAITNVVILAELIKHRIKDVHTITEITTLEVQNEGYDRPRTLTMLKVTVSLKALDAKHVGYTKPIPHSAVTEFTE